MGNTRNSNLTVNVNFDSVAKLQKGSQELQKMGMTGAKAGQDITTGMTTATNSINGAGQAATTNAVKFQTLSQGMLNLSTAGVQTFTSFSNLDRAHNRAAASAVGLTRAQDLLNRKQLALNMAIEQGGEGSDKARLAANELATAYDDLAVKEEKAKIEQAAVLDVQMLFAANIVNVGVSSMQIMGAMLLTNQKKWIFHKLAIIGNTIATKVNALSRWSLLPAFSASTAAIGVQTGALKAGTFATKQATVASKLLTIALGPVGWIIMGISAALVAYETNFYGFKDAVNGFLGIQTDLNEEIETGTHVVGDFSGSVDSLGSSFDKLSTPMKNYIRLMEEMALATGNVDMLTKSLALSTGGAPSNFQIGSSGGATGIGGTGGTSGIGGTGSVASTQTRSTSGGRSTFGKGLNSSLEDSDSIYDGKEPNPFGSIIEKSMFNRLSLIDKKRVLLPMFEQAKIDGKTGMMEVLDKIWLNEVELAINGKEVDPVKAFSDLSHGDLSDIPSVGVNGVKYHDIVGKRGGLSSKAFMQQFKDLDNRQLSKKIYNVDIGEVANSISTNDALRLANFELSLSKFNAPNNGRNLSSFDSSEKIMIGLSSILSKTMGATGKRMFAPISKVSRMNTLELQQRSVENISGIGGQDIKAIAVHEARRAYEDTIKISVPRWVSEARKKSDSFANSGLVQVGQLITRLQNGGVGIVSPLSRSASVAFRNMNIGQIIAGSPNSGGAVGGGDALLQEDFIRINEMFGPETDNLNSSTRRARHRARALLSATLEAIGRATDRSEAYISSGLGIDVNFNAPMRRIITGTYRGGGYIYKWVSTGLSAQAQIAADIGASGDINFPSGSRLVEITNAFNTNGNFSNFNNTGLTNQAQSGLGLTEQQVFDIRFNSTRGDRELLNRLRFVEAQEAASSGTSPL